MVDTEVSTVVVGGFQFGVSASYDDDHEEQDEDTPPTSPNEKTLKPPIARGRRQTVSAEVYDASRETETFRPVKHPKRTEDTERLIKILEPHYLFKHLDDRELANLVELMEPKTYKAGEDLYTDDSTEETSFFHIIMEGTCEVQVGGKVVRTLEPGSTCGETEMMYTQAHTELYIAKSDLKTFCLDRRTYQRTLHSTFAEKRALYCEFLKNVQFLEGLSRGEMIQLADCLEAQKFKAGETIIYCDAPPEAMYIIMEGVVKVVGRDEKNQKIDVCEFTRGAIVGEMEFLNDHKNVADVVAKSDEVRAARLERKHFEMCMGSLKDLLKSSRKADPVYDYYHKKRAAAEGARDPEAGTVVDLTANRLAYTYVGQVKSLMKEGETRVTLNALGRAAETAIATANRLKEGKLVTVIKITTYLSARGVAGIRIVADKTAEFDTLVKEAEAREAAAKAKADAEAPVTEGDAATAADGAQGNGKA